MQKPLSLTFLSSRCLEEVAPVNPPPYLPAVTPAARESRRLLQVQEERHLQNSPTAQTVLFMNNQKGASQSITSP
jgi:hypothetical protein